jgi:AcrR family transcriptional regulator
MRDSRAARKSSLAALHFLMRATTLPNARIAERKLRDKQTRRQQIVDAARRIAELEGWPSVTIRRLAEEIAYSQPVLYSHFESRDAILAAVAIEGFQELGAAMEKARKRARRGSAVEAVAAAYLEFAASSSALYEVMFSLNLSVPFGEVKTPAELRFAFSQFLELFSGHGTKSEVRSELFPGQSLTAEVLSELFWANLHGIAELTRTRRFPRSRRKERLRELVKLFTLEPEAV